MPKYIIKPALRNPITAPPSFDIVPIELKDFVPQDQNFQVKRIYYISNTRGEKKTGQHSHIIEKEMFIVISGQATLIVDEGFGLKEITVKTDDTIWVPNFVWHGFKNLSSDFVLLALSSTNYNDNRNDYIKEHKDFLQRVKSKK